MDISSTIAANKIASAKIKFKVEKSWVVSNNIDENKVFLQRYVNNAWARLTTTMVSSDSSYYYYEADSPGFSTFVITGEKKTAVQSCPYACCVGQSGYADKSCASGFECKSNSCVEKTAEQACSTCPSCSDWSSCANNLSTRTCYKCSADTNYQCASYSESKECKTGVSADMTLVILIVVIIIVIIAGVIFYMKFV
jgi:hypothetical protein